MVEQDHLKEFLDLAEKLKIEGPMKNVEEESTTDPALDQASLALLEKTASIDYEVDEKKETVDNAVKTKVRGT